MRTYGPTSGAPISGAIAFLVFALSAASTISAANPHRSQSFGISQPRVQGNSLSTRTGSVVVAAKGHLKFCPDQKPDAVCWGSYVDSADTTSNFGKLRIVTSPDFPDHLQMRAAGFMEGWLSAERIFDQWTNIHGYFTGQLYPGVNLSSAMSWLSEQELWMKEQVRSKAEEDPQWMAVGLVMAQFDGLVEGYQARAREALQLRREQLRELEQPASSVVAVGWLDRADMMFMNNNGELYDIIDHLQSKEAAVEGKRADVRPDQVFDIISMKGKCSALIKVLGDLSDVFIGHSTWDSFTNALRIFKHYELNLNAASVRCRKLSFSSYPGELFSDDDLYITDTRLVVLETTLHVFHPQLYDALSPLTIPSWYRVRSAFMLSASGEDWVRLFGQHNSGTYNNQYMVVDLNRFQPNQELQSGFLWVVEQIPGSITAIDATQMVSYAYWPSYNVPYFEEVYNATGYPYIIAEMQEEDPFKYEGQIRWFKYQIAPRAAMYRRDQGAVRTLLEMKAMMRYNDWQNDAYSYGNPSYSICGRFDLLDTADARPSGCYDSKVTSYYLALQMEAEVVNGPTLTADKVPFSWQGKWADPQFVHRGHPEVFDFDYERMSPRDLPLEVDAAKPAQS